jgi:hypothetical protein
MLPSQHSVSILVLYTLNCSEPFNKLERSSRKGLTKDSDLRVCGVKRIVLYLKTTKYQ